MIKLFLMLFIYLLFATQLIAKEYWVKTKGIEDVTMRDDKSNDGKKTKQASKYFLKKSSLSKLENKEKSKLGYTFYKEETEANEPAYEDYQQQDGN